MTRSHDGDALVIFGITGDLARKMTFQALYLLERRGLLGCPLIGVAMDDISDDDLRSRARDAIAATGTTVDEETFASLAKRMRYVRGDLADTGTYARIAAAIAGASRPVFYLEIPPALFSTVVKGLGRRPGSRRTHAWWSRSRSATTSPRRARSRPICMR